MNAEQIRQKFIEDNAEFLLIELKEVLRGTGEFSSKSGVWLNYSMEVLEKLVQKASDVREVEVATTKQILEAVSKGKITIADAKELMALLKSQSDIDRIMSPTGDADDTLEAVEFLIRPKYSKNMRKEPEEEASK